MLSRAADSSIWNRAGAFQVTRYMADVSLWCALKAGVLLEGASRGGSGLCGSPPMRDKTAHGWATRRFVGGHPPPA